MKLRFDVDQAECFRRGIDCPKSIVTVDVHPGKISQPERDEIADRLEGIDVMRLMAHQGKIVKSTARIVAKLPTFESLVEAVRENAEALKATEAVQRMADEKLEREAREHGEIIQKHLLNHKI